jgi:hypothetical protein
MSGLYCGLFPCSYKIWCGPDPVKKKGGGKKRSPNGPAPLGLPVNRTTFFFVWRRIRRTGACGKAAVGTIHRGAAGHLRGRRVPDRPRRDKRAFTSRRSGMFFPAAPGATPPLRPRSERVCPKTLGMRMGDAPPLPPPSEQERPRLIRKGDTPSLPPRSEQERPRLIRKGDTPSLPPQSEQVCPRLCRKNRQYGGPRRRLLNFSLDSTGGNAVFELCIQSTVNNKFR